MLSSYYKLAFKLPCPIDSPILMCDDLMVSPGGSLFLTDPFTITRCRLVVAYSLTSVNCISAVSSLERFCKDLVSLQNIIYIALYL